MNLRVREKVLGYKLMKGEMLGLRLEAEECSGVPDVTEEKESGDC